MYSHPALCQISKTLLCAGMGYAQLRVRSASVKTPSNDTIRARRTLGVNAASQPGTKAGVKIVTPAPFLDRHSTLGGQAGLSHYLLPSKSPERQRAARPFFVGRGKRATPNPFRMEKCIRSSVKSILPFANFHQNSARISGKKSSSAPAKGAFGGRK